MLLKFIVTIVLVLIMGVMLLDLRQQRIDAMHDMSRMHGEMNQSRKQVWNHQAKIANEIQPNHLRGKIDRAGLELEPLIPMAVEFTDTQRQFRQDHLEPMDSQ